IDVIAPHVLDAGIALSVDGGGRGVVDDVVLGAQGGTLGHLLGARHAARATGHGALPRRRIPGLLTLTEAELASGPLHLREKILPGGGIGLGLLSAGDGLVIGIGLLVPLHQRRIWTTSRLRGIGLRLAA